MSLNFSVDKEALENLLRECSAIVSDFRDSKSDEGQSDIEPNDLQSLRNQIENIYENVSSQIENEVNSIDSDAMSSHNIPKDVNNIDTGAQNFESEDEIVFVGETRPKSVEVIDLCTPTRYLKPQRKRFLDTSDVQIVELNEKNQKNSETQCVNNNILEHTLDSTQPKVQCAICLESALKRIPATTTCGHIFCYKCISLALKSSRKCPLCKKTNPKLIKLYGLNA